VRILVITPLFVVPPRGACEHDRVSGVRQLVRLGHNVRVLSFTAPWQKRRVREEDDWLGAPVTLMPYRPAPPTSVTAVARRVAAAARRPAFLDGSALPYQDTAVVTVFDDFLNTWQPDLAWFDYTNLWPLLDRAKRAGVQTIVRSLNYEPDHNLQERGDTVANRLRYFSKFLSERASVRAADGFAAITPADRVRYLKLGREDCVVLPLRSLPGLLRPPRVAQERRPLHVFFLGSNYAVSHNRAALVFILDEIVPALRRAAPEEFCFHLLGAKVPQDLSHAAAEDVQLHGFVDNLDAFLEEMDIAIVPSLYGGGMQQKIFEPLCRAFPLVVSPRGLAGFPVRDGEHAVFATTGSEFVAALLRLRDPGTRTRLSEAASRFTAAHFNSDALDTTVGRLVTAAADRRTVVASA
jgi:glycosyltransferase involved in cell wall biosynthesis